MEISNGWCGCAGTAAGSLPTAGMALGRHPWRHVPFSDAAFPAVLRPATLLLRSGQRCKPGHVQAAQKPQGTTWFTASPCKQPRAQLQRSRGLSRGEREPSDVIAVTRLWFMKPQSLESSTLRLGGQAHTFLCTQVSSRTAFSQAQSFFSCSDVGLCLKHPPRSAYPKISSLAFPLTCFHIDAFSAFPSYSIRPAQSKQSSGCARWSGCGSAPQACTSALGSSSSPPELLRLD